MSNFDNDMSAGSRLLSLPPELLEKILVFLEPRQILACQPTCRTLRDVIQNSANIQYQVKLFSACKVDGGSRNKLSPAQCLDILRQQERAWTGLWWRARSSVKLPGGFRIRSDNMLYDGVLLAHNSQLDGGAHVTWGTLPSLDDLEKGSPAQWFHRTMEFRSYGVRADLSQDLLIFLEIVQHSAPQTLNIHLRTFSANSPHHEALQPIIQLALHEDLVVRLDVPPMIKVHGTHVGVLFLDPLAENNGTFVLYDWKRAVRKDRPLHSTLQRAWNSVDFLLESHILLPNTATGCLDLYLYSNEPHSLHHATSFGLPAIHPDWSLTNIVLSPTDERSIPPEPLYSFHRSIYRNDLEESVVVFIIHYEQNDDIPDARVRWRTFVTHTTTFLSYSDYLDPTATESAVTIIPWESWGIQLTRRIIAPRDLRYHYVHGTRFAILMWLNSEQCFALLLHDFNRRCMRMKSDNDDHVKPLIWDGPVYHGERIVRKESTDSMQPWANDVVTSLPYREVMMGPIHDLEGFLMEDERIVGISDDKAEDIIQNA